MNTIEQEPNFNAVTGSIYSIQNQKHLDEHKEAFKLTGCAWAGFKQWQEAGRKVKKGAKGCKIYMVVERKIRDNDGKPQKNLLDEDAKMTCLKGVYVFNIEHTEEI
ncbi:ArdC family protein [Vibrio aquimaris]|uniref:N-terminal domain-containing protein n=1 Tax=Vibrio aquimaris TaxID=2587862 RepID=A0A5P9CRF1_9VIBR|nr:ArdC family protein [Vibrio aquimaris]QFT28808.1 hypothetical protein FIV01_20615 [Vibrio aquimaris]